MWEDALSLQCAVCLIEVEVEGVPIKIILTPTHHLTLSHPIPRLTQVYHCTFSLLEYDARLISFMIFPSLLN